MAISAGDAVIELGLDTKKFDRGLDKVSSKLDRASQKWGRKMKIAGGIMIAAVTAVAVASLKMASDFETAMRSVNTMMLLSEEAFASFRKEVQELAKDMGVSAVESANALYQAISAGIPKENVLEFLRIATEAAIGGITDTTTAVDGLTTVINAFKIPITDAQHVADVMFTTVKGGKTTFAELAASMFNVAPIAAAAGVSFEEVAAALATITKQGVPTAVATTQLRAAIQAVTAPTKRQRKMIDELGLDMSATALQSRGLAGTFNLLMEATGGNMEMMRQLVGSVEAVQAILALTGVNAEVFAADLLAMAEAEGAATAAFLEMEKTPARKLAKLKSSLQDVAITIGTALMPALIRILQIITPLIARFGEWAAKNTKLVIAVLAAVAAIGGLLLTFPYVISGIKAIGVAMTFLAANPIGLLVLAIGAVVAVLIIFIKQTRKTTAEAEKKFQKLATNASTAFRSIALAGKEMTEDLRDDVVNAIDPMFDDIISKIEARKGEFIAALVAMYADATEQTEEELAASIERITGLFDEEIESVKEGKDRINEIYSIAAEENRSLTKEESKEIVQIWRDMYATGMTIASEGAQTQQDVLEKLRTEGVHITASMYADMLTEGKRAKWQAIDEANSKFDELQELALENVNIIPGYTRAMADEDIANAQRERDETIRLAKELNTELEIILAARTGIWETFWGKMITWFQPGGTFWAGPEPPAVGTTPIEFPSVPEFQKGGLIREPTLLYGMKSMRPYATAEAGERVSPAGAGITNTFNISQLIVREEADIQRIARELQRLQQIKGRQLGYVT